MRDCEASKMSALDLLEFSGADYKLEEFVDAFRSQLPLIMIVTIGIDTKDDPLHSISTEDVSKGCLEEKVGAKPYTFPRPSLASQKVGARGY